jgi:hypothetical protein
MAKVTKRVVDAAEIRKKDYVIWDDELPGFGLSGKRSYVIQYRAAGRSRRYIQGLLDGIKFKQVAYALDRDSRKAALAHFLSKASGGHAEEAEEDRRLAA